MNERYYKIRVDGQWKGNCLIIKVDQAPKIERICGENPNLSVISHVSLDGTPVVKKGYSIKEIQPAEAKAISEECEKINTKNLGGSYLDYYERYQIGLRIGKRPINHDSIRARRELRFGRILL
jgi:hypothetical protein